MPYGEIIEIEESDVIEIDIIVDGVSVFYILQPAGKAFLHAAEFVKEWQRHLHHSSSFTFHLMINK